MLIRSEGRLVMPAFNKTEEIHNSEALVGVTGMPVTHGQRATPKKHRGGWILYRRRRVESSRTCICNNGIKLRGVLQAGWPFMQDI